MNIRDYNDDELRDLLRAHEERIKASCNRAYSDAVPFQEEAKRRGITSSKLYDALMKMSDASLRILWKATPKVMLANQASAAALQRVCLRRGLLDE